MRSRMVPFAAGIFAIVLAQANAQSPSADQIIKSLTPTGDVTKQGTRGIRLSQPGDAGAPAAAPATAAGHTGMAAHRTPPASAAVSAPAVDLTVNFESGAADLTAEAMKTLDALGTALSSDALSKYRFRVEGHTDTVGSAASNKALSQRRAKAVVN